jgi:hypothetical protein
VAWQAWDKPPPADIVSMLIIIVKKPLGGNAGRKGFSAVDSGNFPDIKLTS